MVGVFWSHDNWGHFTVEAAGKARSCQFRQFSTKKNVPRFAWLHIISKESLVTSKSIYNYSSIQFWFHRNKDFLHSFTIKQFFLAIYHLLCKLRKVFVFIFSRTVSKAVLHSRKTPAFSKCSCFVEVTNANFLSYL